MTSPDRPLPQVIPVIDLLGGIVVRGVAGHREAYQPLQSQITSSIEPAQVAYDLVSATGATTLYVADLDAIVFRKRSVERYQQIATSGAKLWLDAGVTTCAVASDLLTTFQDRNIAADLVIGLESIPSLEVFYQLAAWNQRMASSQAIFSLDLRHHRPLTSIDAWKEQSPREIAQYAIDAGFARLILLDLASVGLHSGIPTLALASELRAAQGVSIELIVGGGVRSKSDLFEAAAAGADSVLVASALHSRAIELQAMIR